MITLSIVKARASIARTFVCPPIGPPGPASRASINLAGATYISFDGERSRVRSHGTRDNNDVLYVEPIR